MRAGLFDDATYYLKQSLPTMSPAILTQVVSQMPLKAVDGSPAAAAAFANEAVQRTQFMEGDAAKEFYRKQMRFCVLEFMEEASEANKKMHDMSVDQLVRMGQAAGNVMCSAGKGKGEVMCSGGQMPSADRRGFSGGDAVGLVRSGDPSGELIEAEVGVFIMSASWLQWISLVSRVK